MRGNSKPVQKVFGMNKCNVSDTDSSVMMVSEGDFLTLDSNKVYIVTEVVGNGTVRCVSPTNPVNDPIVISVEEATQAFNRQYK
jgi:hypothetical protein